MLPEAARLDFLRNINIICFFLSWIRQKAASMSHRDTIPRHTVVPTASHAVRSWITKHDPWLKVRDCTSADDCLTQAGSSYSSFATFDGFMLERAKTYIISYVSLNSFELISSRSATCALIGQAWQVVLQRGMFWSGNRDATRGASNRIITHLQK